MLKTYFFADTAKGGRIKAKCSCHLWSITNSPTHINKWFPVEWKFVDFPAIVCHAPIEWWVINFNLMLLWRCEMLHSQEKMVKNFIGSRQQLKLTATWIFYALQRWSYALSIKRSFYFRFWLGGINRNFGIWLSNIFRTCLLFSEHTHAALAFSIPSKSAQHLNLST